MSLVSVDDVREALDLQGLRLPDEVIQNCIDAAEGVILPLLVADVDYSTNAQVLQAITLVSCDVFQAQQAANGQSMSLDGQMLPYRMGVSLASRVKGLLSRDMALTGLLA